MPMRHEQHPHEPEQRPHGPEQHPHDPEQRSPDRGELIRWTAHIGAVTAEATALRHRLTLGSARARLLATVRAGQLQRSRPLSGHPALFTPTPGGLRSCGLPRVEMVRVTGANAEHSAACAWAAAALERCYPDYRASGERELRREERESNRSIASARIGRALNGGPLLHRPDLVLWPHAAGPSAPIAVEVELTVKAPRRLRAICLGWARCREVAGVIYVASEQVKPALVRAIDQARAAATIVVLTLASLEESVDRPTDRPADPRTDRRTVVESRRRQLLACAAGGSNPTGMEAVNVSV